jgi:SAM-dependent methyltransferase
VAKGSPASSSPSGPSDLIQVSFAAQQNAASDYWDEVGSGQRPSWYLDPLVASQKRQVHLELFHRWASGVPVSKFLKTDLFEEAGGQDQILFDLVPGAAAFGMDIAWSTTRKAAEVCPRPNAHFFVSDSLGLPLASGSMDLVVSTSTLDHFERPEELRAALAEIVRVVRPGGMLIVTLDNPWNPLYALLRWLSGFVWAPFYLGKTMSMPALCRELGQLGLQVRDTATLIHNPRIISTAIFLVLRKLLGRHADAAIRGLLALFGAAGRLPTRKFTACFNAVCALKLEVNSHPSPVEPGE